MGVPATASSAWCLRPTLRPRRQPPSAVMSTFAPRVVDPVGQRLRGEAPEDDGERRADPGAGEHRDGQLGDHRHVDGDPVARPDAQLLERVGGPAHLALQVGVGDRPGVARLADPVVGDLVAEPALHVPVDAVVRDVEGAAAEPLGERQVPLEGGLERRHPADPLAGQGRPEGLRVAVSLLVEAAARFARRRTRDRARRSAAPASRASISGWGVVGSGCTPGSSVAPRDGRIIRSTAGAGTGVRRRRRRGGRRRRRPPRGRSRRARPPVRGYAEGGAPDADRGDDAAAHIADRDGHAVRPAIHSAKAVA